MVSHATLASTGGDATGMVDPVPRPGTHLTPGSPTSSHTTSGHEPAGLEDVGHHHRADRRLVTTIPRRQGKAPPPPPPVDPFTGEDPEMRFEDWLPSLDRAAEWNQWTPQESLLQLAGHLRGRAHQEWGLRTFAVHLPCFSSAIGLVNVLCRIEAHVRTGLYGGPQISS